MRRLVTDPRDYLIDLGGTAVRGWNAFFFTPADPTTLGVIRVIVGGLLFWSVFVLGLDLDGFLGSTGWASAEAVRSWWATRAPAAWSFWFAIPDSLLRPAWVVALVVLAMFTVGLGSRVTAVLAWAIAVSTARRNPAILYGFDQIISTWALYLAVSGASGRAVSLDRWISRWRQARRALATRPRDGRINLPSGTPSPSIGANLGLRLIQLHLCLIYGMAALAKLRGEAWWNGFAIWGVIAAAEFRRFDLTWLAGYPLFLNVLTHAGLFLELTYPALIWIRRLRPLLLAAVVMLHVGIDITLGLSEFAIAMLAGNLAFVSGPWLRSLVAGRPEDQPAGTLLFDGACPRCRASIALVASADPDRVVAPVDLTAVDVRSIHPSLTQEACMDAMHLVRRDGRVTAGFDAIATLARWLPLAWPFGILAMIPGVAPLGRRVYHSIAMSRPRDVPCSDESCGLRPPTSRMSSPPSGSPGAPASGGSNRIGRPRR